MRRTFHTLALVTAAISATAIAQTSPQPQQAPQGAAPAVTTVGPQVQINNGPPQQPAPQGQAAVALPANYYVVPVANAGQPQGAPMPVPNGGGVPVAGAPLPSPLVDPVTAAVDSVSPMSPSQVRKTQSQLGEREAAMYEGPRASGAYGVVRLDLSPGAKPPTIYVADSQGGTVAFLDAAGKPWPIEKADNYSKAAVSIDIFKENILSVWSLNPYKGGSIAVALKDFPTAVVFLVEPSRKQVSYGTTMIMPQLLPSSQSEFIGAREPGLPGLGDHLEPYLLRTPPAGAKRLRVSGGNDVMAWQAQDGALVIRTSMSMRSPAFSFTRSSSDGTHVYQIPLTPVLGLATKDGRVIYVEVYGYDVNVGRKQAATKSGG